MAEGCWHPYFMKTLLYCIRSFLQILSNNPIHFPVTSNPHPYCFFCCPISLAQWVISHIWCAILFNDNMDLHMSDLGTRRTLICVLCNNASSLVSFETYGISMVLWFDITHTNTHTHTAHVRANILTRPHKYIFVPPVTCWQQLPLLH